MNDQSRFTPFLSLLFQLLKKVMTFRMFSSSFCWGPPTRPRWSTPSLKTTFLKKCFVWKTAQQLCGFCSKVKVKTVIAPAQPPPSPANIKKYYPALTDVAKMDGAFFNALLS